MKNGILGAAVAAALLGLSPIASSQGVGGSAGGTGASGVDTPREAGRPTGPGANPEVTGPGGSSAGGSNVGTYGAPVTSGATVSPAAPVVVSPAAPVTVTPVAPAVTSAGGGVGGSAGGTGASPVDTPREAGRTGPGANAEVTGPRGARTAHCDALIGDERLRCFRAAGASTGASTGIGGVGGSAGGTGASPVDTPREAGRSAPGGNPEVTGPRGGR